MTPKSQAKIKPNSCNTHFLTIFNHKKASCKNKYTILIFNHIMRVYSNVYNYALYLKLL